MAMSLDFRDHLLDLLAGLGPVTLRPMFSGGGVYLEGAMFGLVSDDVLYFRTDDANRGDYEAAGMEPFTPFPGRARPMPYHAVPAEVMEDGDAIVAWARRAWEAARRAKSRSAKPAAKRRAERR